ncbi:MAG: ATP-binding cassette domain-containing protein [Desulfobacterales bacterium]|nr:ATP-binding cassette domain-containing protein [Desulfobacterales bacterium]
MNTPLIEFKEVYKKFGTHEVLRGANLSIFQGEITTIIGKSGVGKSVLLKHIIGLIEPDSGQILFQGKPLSEMKKAEKKALKKKFSYMFQGTALFDSMTVFENIALPLKEKTTLPGKEIQKRVLNKMHQLDLHDIEDQYPSQLSGGMKKRVALVRALITDPEIILFDEPTTGLDPIRKNAVHSMISDYQKRFGFTGVVVSHEIPDIFYISQRIAMIEEGRIVFQGSPKEVQESSDPVINQFVHGLEIRRDDMTGIIPQPLGEERFREEMERLQRYRTSFSLIMLTVENLEEINEKMGHVKGQMLLKRLAAQVQDLLNITDTCSRYGLNKLMVLLPNTDLDQARKFCDKLATELKRKELPELPMPSGLCFSVSAGFVEAQKNSQLETLIANAESVQNSFYEFRVCSPREEL